MLYSFTFKGIRKDYITITKGRKRPPFAPVTRNLLTVPDRPGAYLQSTQTNVRVLEVPVFIQSQSFLDLQKIKEDLAEWLLSDQPEELVFDDETDRVYYAVLDGGLDLEEIVSNGEGVISFICPDPYKYGNEETVSFTNGQATVNNLGTVETYPTITSTITKATTFLAVASQNDVMLIGQPPNVDVTPINPFDSVLYDGMDTTTGWATSSLVPDGGVNVGTLISSGSVFKASSYGTGTTWHGPVMQKSLSQQVQDFQIDVTCKFETTTVSQAGRLEIYGLDVNNKVLFKLAMKDYTNGLELTMPEILVKNDTKSNAILVRNQDDKFDNFYGMLRLKRVGKEFWASVIRVDPTTGKKISTKDRYLFDVNSEFQGKLSSIAVHFGANSTYTVPATNQIHEISIVKYNGLTTNQIPYLAQVGDVIEINHQENSIKLNGESILQQKDFISNFFPLKPGANLLLIEPSDSVTSQVVYRERYL